MIKKIYIVILILGFGGVFFSCRKDTPPPPLPEPEPWEKYIGKYKIYDSLDNVNYTIEISHFIDTNEGGYLSDYLLINNFDNKMDLNISFVGYNNNLDYYTDSVKDYNGFHWGVFSKHDDPNTNFSENIFFNDTIVFYYKITNVKFYLQENQQYSYEIKKRVAIKK